MMENQNNKLYTTVKKKIGMQKIVFDSIIQSEGEIFEWSVEACLNSASKHDNRVIEEAQSIDEQTIIEEEKLDTSQISQMNRTILSPNDPIDLEEEETSFMQEFNKHYGYLSQSDNKNKRE